MSLVSNDNFLQNAVSLLCVAMLVFFFFQAEDGIRDLTVTGVQTCALPIFGRAGALERGPRVRLRVARAAACGARLWPGARRGGAAARLAIAGPGALSAKIGRASCRGRV